MKTRALRHTLGAIITFLAVALHYANADTLDIWRWRNPLPNDSSYFQVQFLNGQFFGYGLSPQMITSTDGTNWSAFSLPFDAEVYQLTSGNGRYVLVGTKPSGGPLIASSPDFSNWTLSNVATTTPLGNVAFGGGLFVATGPGLLQSGTPVMLVSSNGVDWSQTSTLDAPEVAYGNGVFVAAHNNPSGLLFVSSDGYQSNFTDVGLASGKTFRSISFANGRFYASGYYSQSLLTLPVLYTSTDGLNWSLAPSDPRTDGHTDFHAIFGNGILLGEGASVPGQPLSVSTDGSNFVAFTANNLFNSDQPRIAFGNGVFVDGYLQTSVDATNWSDSPIYNSGSYYILELIYGTNGYVAVPAAQPLLQSSNGLKFSFLTNTIPVAAPRIKSAAGIHLAVGFQGALAVSTNELDWFPRNSATTSTLNDVEHGNSAWVAVGADGAITTSSTANTWSLSTSGTSMALNGIAYGTNLFVAVGNTGTILTSPDGISWSPQFAGTVVNLNGIVYANGLFIAVGAQGTIITSPDGTNWTSQASGVLVGLGSIAAGEGTFCTVTAGNQTNMVALTSTDGISWKPHRTDALHQLTIKAYSGVRYFNGTFFIFCDDRILQSGPITSPKLQLSFNGSTPNITVQTTSNLLLHVQSAQNPTGPWQDLGLFTNSTGSFVIPDNSASSQSQHFYRTSVP